MKELFNQITNREDLSKEQIEALFDGILNSGVSESEIVVFLTGLKVKGKTPSEIIGIVYTLKNHAVDLPRVFDDAMCNYGTGNDQSYSFNISTTACFILAAGGIRTAKFGNHSVSSKSGSTDVLGELGINITASPETPPKALDEVGAAFAFAQTIFPAMRFIGPVRQVLGIPVIMNIVGSLANPPDLKTQLVGLCCADLQETTAQVIQKLGRKRAIIIIGSNNMDGAALYGTNTYALLDNGKISQRQFTYQDFEMPKIELDNIVGEDARQNAEILLSALRSGSSPYLEIAILNAGLDFHANGEVGSLEKDVSLVRQLIADSLALVKPRQLQEVQI